MNNMNFSSMRLIKQLLSDEELRSQVISFGIPNMLSLIQKNFLTLLPQLNRLIAILIPMVCVQYGLFKFC